MFPITFDWAQIAYIGSPLLTPWWAAANVVGGLVLVMWIAAPIMCKWSRSRECYISNRLQTTKTSFSPPIFPFCHQQFLTTQENLMKSAKFLLLTSCLIKKHMTITHEYIYPSPTFCLMEYNLLLSQHYFLTRLVGTVVKFGVKQKKHSESVMQKSLRLDTKQYQQVKATDYPDRPPLPRLKPLGKIFTADS